MNDDISTKVDSLKKLGFHVFPLPPNQKFPPVKNFKETNNLDVPTQQLVEDFDLTNDTNLGVCLNHFKDLDLDLSLFVLDVDNKDEQSNRNGIPEYALLKEKYNLPDTFTVITPNNGFHYYFYTNSDLLHTILQTTPKNPPNCPGIDIRTYKNYVVSPFSSIDNNYYTPLNINTPIAKLPTNFLKSLNNSPNLSPLEASQPSSSITSQIAPGIMVDAPEHLDAAAKIVFNALPTDSGNRNNLVYQTSSDIKRLGVSMKMNLTLMNLYNQTKCIPPLSENELSTTVKSVYTNNQNMIGSDANISAENQFSQFAESTAIKTQTKNLSNEEIVKKLLTIKDNVYRARTVEELSAITFTVMTSAGVRYTFNTLKYNPIAKSYQILTKLVKIGDLKEFYGSILVPHVMRSTRFKNSKATPQLTNLVTVADDMSKLLVCEQTVFEPGKPKIYDNKFNEWNGHPFRPTSIPDPKTNTAEFDHYSRTIDLVINEYIFKVLASSNHNKHEYILSWIAKRIQDPTWRPNVAMAFYGDRGTGKSFLTEKLLFTLIGIDYCFHYADIDSFKSNFNSEQATAQIISLEEMINANSHKNRGVIKSLITAENSAIEQKFKDKEYSPRRYGVIISSNNSHCIPAEFHERRYFITKVSNHRMQNREFFQSILQVLAENDNEGWQYLYTYLSDPAIITMNPDKALLTDELRYQIEETMGFDDSIFAFIHHYNSNDMRLDAQHDCRVGSDDAEFMFSEYSWPDESHIVSIKDLYRNYTLFCEETYGSKSRFNNVPQRAFTPKLLQSDSVLGLTKLPYKSAKLMPDGSRSTRYLAPSRKYVEKRIEDLLCTFTQNQEE